MSELITVFFANRPYTVHYLLGAKMVGLRTGNQATDNGQFRIVGDYLGSTTLVLDTASPSDVVQRQYAKPYGETAWRYTVWHITSDEHTGGSFDKIPLFLSISLPEW